MNKISVEDLYQFRFSGNPRFSSDGQSLVYVLAEIDQEANKYRSSIRLIDLATGHERNLTSGLVSDEPAKDFSPQFSPDGLKIAYLSNRTGKNQIYLLDLAGGEAKRLTNFKEGIRSFIWSPDSSYLVAVARKESDVLSDVKVINRLRYREDGEGFYGSERIHLWKVSVSGDVAQLTHGEFDEEDPAFSPDGKTILFISWRSHDEREVTPSLYAMDLDTQEIREIAKGKGNLYAPAFSPNGSQVAYFGHELGETSAANSNVYVVTYPEGKPVNLTAQFDRTVGNVVGTDARYDGAKHCPRWSADGGEIYFLATDGGNAFVYKVNVQSASVEKIAREEIGSVTSFDVHGDKIAYIFECRTRIGEVFLLQNEETKPLTHNNDRLFSERAVAEPERIEFMGADGWKIEGWILKPPFFQETEKYPLVLEIHGGPHAVYGNCYHHEFQCLAANGYVVLYTNPRGSHGYGEKFVQACVGDWGGKDYEDLMKAVDFVETLPYIDKRQEFVTGGSYGGIMTNWIVGHTNRFKAAVTQRSICNLHSMMGTSDIGFWFNSKELGGADMWEDEEFILSRSPIRYARSVQTPIKILHSEEDYRCPMEQAEQWYTALKRLGVETELVRFPGDSHDLSRSGNPKHRIERLEHIIGWFNRYRTAQCNNGLELKTLNYSGR